MGRSESISTKRGFIHIVPIGELVQKGDAVVSTPVHTEVVAEPVGAESNG
jgi:hypothetical protein